MFTSVLRGANPNRLVLIFVIAKVLFFIFLTQYNPRAFYFHDSMSYVDPAIDMLRHGTFSRNQRFEVFRTPGYSVFLLPVVVIFGSANVYLAVLLQILIGAMIALLIHRLILNRYSDGLMANIGMLIVLADPAMLIAEFSLLSDLLYAAVLTAGMYLLIEYERKSAPILFIAGTALIAISAYVKPLSLYLGSFLCLMFLVRILVRKEYRFAPVIVVAFLLNFLILQTWVKRNEALFGEPIFSSVQGFSLYTYTAAAIQAHATRRSYMDIHRQFQEDIASPNPVIQAQHEQQRALEIMTKYPISTVLVLFKGLFTNKLDPGTGMLANMLDLRVSQSGIISKFQDMPTGEFVSYLLGQERALLFFLGIGAVWIAFFWLVTLNGLRTVGSHAPGFIEIILIMTILYLLVLSAGPASTARFRVPAIPLLAIFAAIGICSFLKQPLEVIKQNDLSV